MKLEGCQEASIKNGSDFLKIICSTKNSSGCDFFEIIICFEYPIQVQEIMPHRLRLPLLRLRSSSVAQLFHVFSTCSKVIKFCSREAVGALGIPAWNLQLWLCECSLMMGSKKLEEHPIHKMLCV